MIHPSREIAHLQVHTRKHTHTRTHTHTHTHTISLQLLTPPPSLQVGKTTLVSQQVLQASCVLQASWRTPSLTVPFPPFPLSPGKKKLAREPVCAAPRHRLRHFQEGGNKREEQSAQPQPVRAASTFAHTYSLSPSSPLPSTSRKKIRT